MANPPRRTIEGNRKRDAEIRGLWHSGQWTLAAIARKFGITDSRVWQIVNRPRPQPEDDKDA
jgi:hypothetical protein